MFQTPPFSSLRFPRRPTASTVAPSLRGCYSFSVNFTYTTSHNSLSKKIQNALLSSPRHRRVCGHHHWYHHQLLASPWLSIALSISCLLSMSEQMQNVLSDFKTSIALCLDFRAHKHPSSGLMVQLAIHLLSDT